MTLDPFHPAVASWFHEAFPGGPTEGQRQVWPRIARGENVLLVSPTGTGKTLAAFLVSLDRLLRRRLAGDAAPRLSTLYISPLKALNNDVHRNLELPRLGIRRELARRREAGAELPEAEISTAVRTGDTSTSARAAILKHAPDILITTPESLYLLLTGSGRRLLSTVDTVILDEVHSLAGTKRGAHLALSLERLEALLADAGRPSPQRVALSATIEPPDVVAAFAAGVGRAVTPVVVKAPKRLELRVLSPGGIGGNSMIFGAKGAGQEGSWGPAIDFVAGEVATYRTTLVFCNSRRQAERISALLEERLGAEVPTHHGAVARAPRETIERSLKAGELKVVVATGSLELGLDVGHVDAVVQIGSPRGVARALQRVGRSGHLVGETSRGLFVPLFADDLLECAATVEGMREGAVEETRPPEFPLDVLAQQIVAEAVSRPGATADGLFGSFAKAYPYRNLTRRLFHETLAMLSGKYPRERFAELAPKLAWDRATDRVHPLPGARLAAVLDGGTISDRGSFRAVLPDRKTVVGELDEEFVYETRPGDVFLLGARSWRATEIEHDRIVVEDATGQPARMPFWRGEGVGRTPALGERIGRLKRRIEERLEDPSVTGFLRERYGCDEPAAATMVGAVRAEAADSGGVATERRVVFETFPNDLGDPCVVVRSVFGRGVNLPWSLVLASLLREETGVDVEAVTSDDGILLRTPQAERELPIARLSRVSPEEARERLLADLPNSPMFGAQFRQNAQRALLLPRRRAGRRTPFWLQRLKAKDLLQTTRSLPDFPIVAETYRDCLRDLWAYERLMTLLADIAAGRVEVTAVKRRTPSPAAAGLLFRFIAVYMYEWDAPRAEKGLHALAANRALLGEVLGEPVEEALRPEAVREASAEAARLLPHRMARSPEELLIVFGELGDLTVDEARVRCDGAEGVAWIEALIARGSLVRVTLSGEERLTLPEERERLERMSAEDRALDAVLSRLVATAGPVTSGEAAARYDLPAERVEAALERLRLEGLAVRGRFGRGETSWVGARLYESMRRRSLTILRREIRPVSLDVFRGFLARRQGLEVGSRFAGAHAAEHALSLLRGLPLPVLSWENSILPSRLEEPQPDALDVLSARGLLVWRAAGEKDPKAARLSFLFRGEGRLVLPESLVSTSRLEGLSEGARALYERFALLGASFLADLAAPLGLAPDAANRALVELVLAGLVTGDGLGGLRQLLSRKRPAAKGESTVSPRGAPALGAHPGRGVLRAAESRVAERLGRGGLRLPHDSRDSAEGRFSLLGSPGVLGAERSVQERAEGWARLLLARWGVVHRGLLERESADCVRWADVGPVFARMELRGDLRRGEFVEGGGPVQYAEPDVVETLRERAATRPERGDLSRLAVAGGADPALVGISAATSDWLVLSHGEAALRLTSAGELTLGEAVPDRLLREGLELVQGVLKRVREPLGRPRRLSVSSVNGRPAAGSPYSPILSRLGFARDGESFGWRAL